jgi:2,3,4,5-tetrahydropyridine-2-carboxylate N-succinyltransferase
MIDSHALVGSCAQVGKKVHLSAGVQVGAGVGAVVGAVVGGNVGAGVGAIVGAGVILIAKLPPPAVLTSVKLPDP